MLLIVVECIARCRLVFLPWTEQRLSAWELNQDSPGGEPGPAWSALPWGCAVVQKAGKAERDGKPLHCETVLGESCCSYTTWDVQWHICLSYWLEKNIKFQWFPQFYSSVMALHLLCAGYSASLSPALCEYVFSSPKIGVHVGQLSLNKCKSSSQHPNTLQMCKEQKHRSLQMLYIADFWISILFSRYLIQINYLVQVLLIGCYSD